MLTSDLEKEARRLFTERCLIAADIDKTLLTQSRVYDNEREEFLTKIAPQLLLAASYGTNLALLTGNSMHELCSRFLKGLIDHLCSINRIALLERFHFFCNAGGTYANFSNQNQELTSLFNSPRKRQNRGNEVFSSLTVSKNGKLSIKPRYIDRDYIERSRIPEEDIQRIEDILKQIAKSYIDDLKRTHTTYEKGHNLDPLRKGDEFILPCTDLRLVEYGIDNPLKQASVQITLKPILSFHHADKKLRSKLVGRDLRSKVIAAIQSKLDENGLSHYLARPGGTSSIDITLEKLDKAYALEFLIDHLNLQGSARLGQKFGSNAIYFGDEVNVGGGNDFPVTKIPGLLVFAVNFDKELIPLLSHVLVPSTILEGPDATAEVLQDFNKCAYRMLRNFTPSVGKGKKKQNHQTAIESLKKEIFANRIVEKISNLKDTTDHSVEDWQTLHVFVTLMCRKDPAARQWLAILINELDAIMTQLTTTNGKLQPIALGTSHPDMKWD
jgi:hydroxymethylpyrimidine pyrophosphatase-like HAD family hydrolase